MSFRRRYMSALKRVNRSRGKRRRRLRTWASAVRKRMISENGRRSLQPSRDYMKLLGKAGPKALKKFRQFWGVPYPGKVTAVQHGKGRGKLVLVGMGHSPAVILADGPEGRHTRIWKDRKKRVIATDPSGKRIYIIDPKLRKPVGRRLRLVGYAPESHYVPFRSVERAGSRKKGRYWIHKHGKSERGEWPRVYRDDAGNYIYGRGTYRVNAWIEH